MSERWSRLAFWLGLGVLVLGGGALLARFATAGDGAWLNLPHKDYWLAPKRRVMMLITGVAADRGGSAPGWWFWVSLGPYLGGTALWTVWLLRRNRPPAA